MTPKEIQKHYPSFNPQRFFIRSNREPTKGAYYLIDSSNCIDSREDIKGNWVWTNGNKNIRIAVSLQRSEKERNKRIEYLNQMTPKSSVIYIFKRIKKNDYLIMGEYKFVKYENPNDQYFLYLSK